MPRRIIIDTDPGIDDALAIALALRSIQLKVEAITTVCGNVSVDHGTRNALMLAEAFGGSTPPPVARGAERPLKREPVHAAHVHGDDGIGGITQLKEPDGKPKYPAPRSSAIKAHAVDLILDTVKKNPGEITVVAIGPLTNVAHAIQRNRATMEKLNELIVMGGAVSGRGNVTATAEFNFYADPEAAQQVLHAGLNTTLVGLDVTEKTLLPKADFEKALGSSKRTADKLLMDLSPIYFAIAEKRSGKPSCPLHDPLAIGVAIDPTFVKTKEFAAEVETHGKLTSGMLVADYRSVALVNPLHGRVRAGIEVEADRFVDYFLRTLSNE